MAAASGAGAANFGGTGAVVATSGTSTGTLAGLDSGTQSGSGNPGLPCDVEQLLVARCQSCHGSPPTL
ncbi:MAG TPA: hypothetical protein VGY54_16245, partial [Polyangiaceae bacterium]|nr:hypothetical protein [Polyangiaceae bacterium]